MANLRQRRHEQIGREIVDAAFALFRARGYADVTMSEIAEASGVSRSTAYRRFATKDDVVLDVPRRWLEAFDVASNQLSDDAGTDEAIEATTLAVAAHIDDNIDIVMEAYAVLEQAPGLHVSGVATVQWRRRMVALLERHGDFDPETNEILAGAYLGAIDAVMFHWVAGGGGESVVNAIRRLHHHLRPILRSDEY